MVSSCAPLQEHLYKTMYKAIKPCAARKKNLVISGYLSQHIKAWSAEGNLEKRVYTSIKTFGSGEQ